MTYIIAEIGSNWRDFNEAKDSIAVAKNCGADAVKFQMFSHTELYGYFTPIEMDAEKLPKGATSGKITNKLYGLHPEDIPKLAEKAAACGIDFMCTAFSPEGVKFVDPFVKAHKISSCELSYVQLLEAVRDTGKPVYLSVGASSWGDVAKALQILGTKNVTLMYCCVEYPSTWHNLRLINTLRDKFGVAVGFSDHSLDLYTPVTAAHIHGAVAIEKHFKSNADIDSPDAGHSLEANKFMHMVELIRNPNAVMKMPNPGEYDAIMRHNRRLVATVDIQAGQTFKFGENYGTYRSLEKDSHGLSGFEWEVVNGKLATKSIGAGKTIGPGDF
jgi:N,N'-diacetyllegionaminate synthase